MISTDTTSRSTLRAIAQRAGFYVSRLRKEKVTKVAVSSVASLALVLQLAVGVLPFTSTPALAVGDDNIIKSGITGKEDLLAIYDRGTDSAGHADIKQIYTHFGVSRADIANATMGTYKTNDFNGQIKTIGRTNWPNSGRTPVKVTDSTTTVYTGPFLDNENGKPNQVPALIGKRSIDGQWFAITLNCGNIVYTVTPPAPVKPSTYACDSLTATRISRTTFRFATTQTLQNATLRSTTYVVTNTAGQELSRSTNPSYTQTTAGTYTVKAILSVVDSKGEVKAVTAPACSAQFTVAAEVTPVATPVKKCAIAGKENFTADSERCVEDKCAVVGKETLPANSPDCVVTPVVTPATPTELPTTGIGEQVMKVIGLGALIASAGYYISSRRGYLSSLLNR